MLEEEEIAVFIRKLLQQCGENPSREGLVKTPHRFYKAFIELTQGYRQNIDTVINGALFDSPSTEPIELKAIPFFSLCEHHLLPFFGHCDIVYVPNNKVLGLSKIYRIVEFFSKRLQLQERLTQQIGSTLQEVTQAKAVLVNMYGTHLCVAMRGVQKTQSVMHTTYRYGDIIRNAGFNEESQHKDCILKIATLDLPLVIGCYEEEKNKTTPVQITIELKLENLNACFTDKLEDTVCYDQLIKCLQEQCFKRHYQLIEHACSCVFEKTKAFLEERKMKALVRVCFTKKLQHTTLLNSQFTVSDF